MKDPKARYSIADIYKHPWFKKDLPRDLESTDPHTLPFKPPQTDADVRRIVEEVRGNSAQR